MHCAGEILNFWVVQLLCSRWCKHRAVIQWMENSLKKNDCWLFINTKWEETLGCARMAFVSHSPLTHFSRGEVFCHLDLLSFQMVHFVGMPLMCSDTEFYAWSLLKHQKHNWFPIFTLFYLRACCCFLGQHVTCTQRTEVIVKLSCWLSSKTWQTTTGLWRICF